MNSDPIEKRMFTVAERFTDLMENGNRGQYTQKDEDDLSDFLQRLQRIKQQVNASRYSVLYDTEETPVTGYCQISGTAPLVVKVEVLFFE